MGRQSVAVWRVTLIRVVECAHCQDSQLAQRGTVARLRSPGS